jgi:hypothetical protein
MSVSATYSFFVGLLLSTYGAFIAVPAWSRWVRNLKLVRVGDKTSGRYQGHCQIAFLLEPDRQIIFSTWRATVRRANIGDELSVLYDPASPARAEVLTRAALWHTPLDHLALAASAFLTTIIIWCGMNLELALLISLPVDLLASACVRMAFYALYPPARLKRFNEQDTDADPSSSFEIFSGPGKIYSRQRRRLRRQQDWKVQPHNREVNELADEEAASPAPPKRRAAREQLLHDMIGPFDQ